MNEDINKLMAAWSNVNETITKTASAKAQMTPSEHRALVERLYERKRMLWARLRALRPVTKNDLRVNTTWRGGDNAPE